jgi:methyl-accepting chemotaxis protein|tara:strand:+ start:959 stop:1354 length:396 start_codon:yes stop_codon:yes gene_type:complete
MRVSEKTSIAMPIKNLISIIAAVAIGVWAYFGITEKLNSHSTQLELMQKDLDKAVEFSIKWPRGEMGSLPADAEQFLLIEDALKDIEDIQEELKESRHNATNISRLQKDVDRLLDELEKLKDKVRANGSSH